ncbi:hypothetical protein [Bacillus cereus]|uniref:Uncharacterized protein n=1 Tax=Bacillus cereus VD184 TaxID=1053242 RepID=A0A9W5R086_BACCE|nr:hypothetical protein [Bacillus cereus]EOQ01002.1 hypothetical protein IKC_06200 [Bacillus cereus VD184]
MSKVNVDELKVYTGGETLKALMEGKILNWETDQYKLDGEFLYEKNGNNDWTRSYRSIDHFMRLKFTEVATPQVGDWVRVELPDKTIIGCVTEVDNLVARIEDRLVSLKHYCEILSPEQVSEYKREQAFVKVGRKPNEFKPNDIVFVNSLGITAIVISNSNNQEVRLHQINHGAKGYTAKPHQLRPISFVEQQVDLS